MTKAFWDEVRKAIGSTPPDGSAGALPDPSSKPSGRSLYVPGAKVDVVFTIDTTGSMSDKIEGLLQTTERFVLELSQLGLDARIAIVAFGDLRVPGDKIVKTEFTTDVAAVQKSLRNIPRYSGGGNEGESSLEALQKVLGLTYRPDALRLVLLITDEPADQHEIKAKEIIRRLKEAKMLTFTVTPRHSYYQEMARETGGKWYKISRNTDFTELLRLFQHIAQQAAEQVAEAYLLRAKQDDAPTLPLS